MSIRSIPTTQAPIFLLDLLEMGIHFRVFLKNIKRRLELDWKSRFFQKPFSQYQTQSWQKQLHLKHFTCGTQRKIKATASPMFSRESSKTSFEHSVRFRAKHLGLVWRNNPLPRKTYQLTHTLKELCKSANLYFIEPVWTVKTNHFNGSKLHIKKYRTRVLFNNIPEENSNIAFWHFLFM